MRQDMFKVIVERPRRGVGYWRTVRNFYRGAKSFKLDDEDDVCDMYSCTKLPMKHRKIGYEGKSLNENLNPLKRYLESQAGRPWDDVYSELSENLNPNSTVKQHVRDHVVDYVSTHTWRCVDGRVYNDDGYCNPCDETGELYVEPETGLLLKGDRGDWRARNHASKAADAKERATRLRVLSPTARLVRADRVWYFVVVAPITDETLRARDAFGVELNRYTRYKGSAQDVYGGYVYAVSRRTLSKKELRDYQLKGR